MELDQFWPGLVAVQKPFITHNVRAGRSWSRPYARQRRPGMGIFLFLFLFPVLLSAQDLSGVALPYVSPDFAIAPLNSLVDASLQQRLAQRLNANTEWKSLIARKKLAVGIVDLNDPYNVRFARVNGEQMMYAASLPKIAILLAAMDALEKGELKETEEVRRDMRLMIARSDNQASTRMIDRLGYKKIESVLTDPRYDLYDEDQGGGLWVGKRYAKQGQRYPDPLMGLSHAATVSQVCRFYYLLLNGRLVSYKRSRQMLEIMADPELHHKFVNTLDKVAPDAKLFRKSGSWSNFHADSVMVWENEGWRRYILVALAEAPNGEQIMRDLVTAAEDVLRPQAGSNAGR